MDEGGVTEVFEDHREVQIDKYETDSDDEESDFEEHSELVNRACVTRSGKAVRAFVRLDMHVTVRGTNSCLYAVRDEM